MIIGKSISPFRRRFVTDFYGGCSFIFDAANKNLTIPNASIDSIVSGAGKSYCFGFVAYVDDYSSANTLITNSSVLAQKSIDFEILPTGNIQLVQYSGGAKVLRGTFDQTSNWIYCIASIDGVTPANSKIWANGVELVNVVNSLTGSTVANALDFAIANDSAGGVNLKGGINQEFIIEGTTTSDKYHEWYNLGGVKNPYTVFGTDCKWALLPKDAVWGGANFTVIDTVNSITATSFNLLEVDKDCTLNPYTGIVNKFDNIFEQSLTMSEETRYDIRTAGSIWKFNYEGTYLAFKANPTIFGSFPDQTEIVVKVDGVVHTVKQVTAWTALYEVTLPAGAKVVELIESLTTRPGGNILGTYLTEILVTGESFSKIGFGSVAESDTIVTDSIGVGAFADIPSTEGVSHLLRTRQGIPTTIIGNGFDTLKDHAETAPLVAATVALIVESFAKTTTTKNLIITLGTNDFGLDATASVTFLGWYEDLVDAVNVADPTINIFCKGALIRAVDGALLDEYRDGTEAFCLLKSWCTYIDGKSILTTGAPHFFDAVHPTTLGHAIDNIATAAIVHPLILTEPINYVPPVISGLTGIGDLLTATEGIWVGTLPIVKTYQWQRDGGDIPGATASTYTTVIADDGTTVTCDEKGTNTAGNSTSTSNGLAIVDVNLAQDYIDILTTEGMNDALSNSLYGFNYAALQGHLTTYFNAVEAAVGIANVDVDYLMIGGAANFHKYNAFNPVDSDAANRLTFLGGWIHSATGAKPNGTNASADTHYVLSVKFAQNDNHLSFYSRSNPVGSLFYDMGCRDNVSWTALDSRNNAIGGQTIFAMNVNDFEFENYFTANSAAYFETSRLGSNVTEARVNGILKATGTKPSRLPTTRSVYLGAYNNIGVAAGFSPRECAGATFGKGMTTAQSLAMYNARQTLNTALGRQV